MPSLYELDALSVQIEIELQESNGEMSESFEAFVNSTEDAIADKFEAICKLRANKKAMSEACRSEEKRIAAKRKVEDNAVKYFERRLLESMTVRGIKKQEAGTFTVSRQKNGGVKALKVDVGLIPDEYVIQEPKPDKDALRAALDSGEVVEGAYYEPRSEGIRIR